MFTIYDSQNHAPTVLVTVSAEQNRIDITAYRVPTHWQFQDAVTNILESIESGVIPEKEGSAMIKRRTPVYLEGNPG